jgi:hypothetical protein
MAVGVLATNWERSVWVSFESDATCEDVADVPGIVGVTDEIRAIAAEEFGLIASQITGERTSRCSVT